MTVARAATRPVAAGVKYHGLDPRTRLAALGPGGHRASGSSSADGAVGRSATWPSPGRRTAPILPWVVERLFGFLAYVAMAGSVIYGLLLSTKILDAIAHRPITFTLHQDLAAIGLALAGGPRQRCWRSTERCRSRSPRSPSPALRP